MNTKFLWLGLFCTCLLLASSAPATVINFDDINTNGGCCTTISNGYQGLDWNNFLALDATSFPYSQVGYGAGMVSPPNVAFNGFGTPSSFSSTSTFTLTSGYFTGAWNDGLNITIQGFLNGNLVDTKTIVVNSTSPTLETFNWSNINEVTFDSFGGTPNPNYQQFGSGEQFVLDNLTINGSTSVPEPASLLLLGSGLLGLGRTIRRKR